MKTDLLVIDSSVIFKWFDRSEIDSDKALRIYDQLVKKALRIVVPDLVVYEITNAWSTKTKFSLKEIKDNLAAFQAVDLLIEPISFDLIKKALIISYEFKVSVYDAIYAVLAKEKKCNLVTADSKFVKGVNLAYVRDLGEYILI